MIFYKFLREGRGAVYGYGAWPEVGVWTPTIEPILCESGWHLCRPDDVARWCAAAEMYAAEVAPGAVVVGGDDKIVASSARLVRRIDTWTPTLAAAWAAECAERVASLRAANGRASDYANEAAQSATRATNTAAIAALAAASAAENAAAAAARLADADRFDGGRSYAAARRAIGAERRWQSARLLEMLGETWS